MTSLPPPKLPRHIAVVMDGNGRWAAERGQPRPFGHRRGVVAARRIVEACSQRRIEILTLFAFSQENWSRPVREVTLLMKLFESVLTREIKAMHQNGIRLRFIGDHSDFPPVLCGMMNDAAALTRNNTGLTLQIAIGYGGHWDIAQAAQSLCAAGKPINTESLQAALMTAELPPPDLLIRTGGERRLSNFLMWQLAYTELHFTDTLWPDYDQAQLDEALAWYASRERRFGRVPETK